MQHSGLRQDRREYFGHNEKQPPKGGVLSYNIVTRYQSLTT
jgi:hypothetical protein